LTEISLEKVKERAEIDAKRNGCYLNPDPKFLKSLLEGLKQNEERYNYPSCPCRLASGKIDFDRDIICPCDYRDPDVAEFGACYCALYVDEKVIKGTIELDPVPERRPLEKQARAYGGTTEQEKTDEIRINEGTKANTEIKLKLWYCKQCGYVAFREDPPLICPICRAKKEMFTEIKTQVSYST
jgi:ferredoxin-thioredoxin reductase catalytic subunit